MYQDFACVWLERCERLRTSRREEDDEQGAVKETETTKCGGRVVMRFEDYKQTIYQQPDLTEWRRSYLYWMMFDYDDNIYKLFYIVGLTDSRQFVHRNYNCYYFELLLWVRSWLFFFWVLHIEPYSPFIRTVINPWYLSGNRKYLNTQGEGFVIMILSVIYCLEQN